MHSHMMIIGGLRSQYFTANHAQECRSFIPCSLAYHIGWNCFRSGAIKSMHNSYVCAQAQEISASFTAPAAPHRFDIALIRDPMPVFHVQMEIIKRLQINVTIIAK